jgi:hypothetical protein
MDMETIKPRTCTMCYGTGLVSWLSDEEGTFETEECECQYKGDKDAQIPSPIRF